MRRTCHAHFFTCSLQMPNNVLICIISAELIILVRCVHALDGFDLCDRQLVAMLGDHDVK